MPLPMVHLSVAAIYKQKEGIKEDLHTFSFFEDSEKEPHIIPQYITDDMVHLFVEDMAKRIGVILHDWEESL